MREILSLRCDQGIVVGILGPWGSGKTSFINLAKEEFRSSNTPVLEFNPWMFSNFSITPCTPFGIGVMSGRDQRSRAVGVAHVRPAIGQRPNGRRRALCPEGARHGAPSGHRAPTAAGSPVKKAACTGLLRSYFIPNNPVDIVGSVQQSRAALKVDKGAKFLERIDAQLGRSGGMDPFRKVVVEPL